MDDRSVSGDERDTQPAPAARRNIAHKAHQRADRDKLTVFDLPRELRNRIYHYALAIDYQRVPLNPFYLNKPNPAVSPLLVCSAIYHEARSYMTAHQTAYVSVLDGLDWTYGKPALDYGLSRATKDTTVCALMEFKSVHFHLHLDLLYKQEYSPPSLLN